MPSNYFFRIRDKETGQYFYRSLDSGLPSNWQKYYDVDMQIEGIRSNTSAELFENDIVSVIGESKKIYHRIEWVEAGFILVPPYEPRDLFELGVRGRLRLEGNIYDNQELLDQ